MLKNKIRECSLSFRIPFLGKSVKYNPHKHPFFVENWYKKGYARSNTDKNYCLPKNGNFVSEEEKN